MTHTHTHLLTLLTQLNEEMTYGKSIDPFNFRLALRHLKVTITKSNANTAEFFVTFNNTNQMLWHGSDDVVMQIIKFDGIQMMMSICGRAGEPFYTILAMRDYSDDDDKRQVDTTRLHRLILQGRNLKVHSKFNLEFNCNCGRSSFEFNFGALLLSFVMCLAANVVPFYGF